MEELGRVVDVHGRVAKVEFTSKEACAHCGARIMCHFTPSNAVLAEAFNDRGAEVGDLVRVEVDPKRSIFTGLLIFIFPIIVFMMAFLAVRTVAANEGYGVVGGVISLLLYFIFLKRLEHWLAHRGTFSPVVREIIKPADT